MKELRLLIGLLIGMVMLSCSKDELKETRNGFNYNGTFHETDFAFSDSDDSPYHLLFSNLSNPNQQESHIASFYLDSGTEVADGPLIEGRYSSGNGPRNLFGIHGYQSIQFQENYNIDEIMIASGYWHQDERFISADVTINSISSTEDNLITRIDVDYTFKWNSVTVYGHYSGPVLREDY